jgi:hypothetical protein
MFASLRPRFTPPACDRKHFTFAILKQSLAARRAF